MTWTGEGTLKKLRKLRKLRKHPSKGNAQAKTPQAKTPSKGNAPAKTPQAKTPYEPFFVNEKKSFRNGIKYSEYAKAYSTYIYEQFTYEQFTCQ